MHIPSSAIRLFFAVSLSSHLVSRQHPSSMSHFCLFLPSIECSTFQREIVLPCCADSASHIWILTSRNPPSFVAFPAVVRIVCSATPNFPYLKQKPVNRIIKFIAECSLNTPYSHTSFLEASTSCWSNSAEKESTPILDVCVRIERLKH